MRFEKFIAAAVMVFCLSGVPATAQPFSVDQLPLHINAKIDADAVRVDRNIQLNVITTVTVYNINELIAGFLKQVNFPDCDVNRFGYAISVKIDRGESKSGFVLSAAVTGCIRDSYGIAGFFRVADRGAVRGKVLSGSIPISFKLADRRYIVLELGKLRVDDNAVAEFLARVGEARIEAEILRGVAGVNEMLKRSQASVFSGQLLNVRSNREPEAYLSLGGSLVMQAHLAGRISTASINALIGNALQRQSQNLTH